MQDVAIKAIRMPLLQHMKRVLREAGIRGFFRRASIRLTCEIYHLFQRLRLSRRCTYLEVDQINRPLRPLITHIKVNATNSPYHVNCLSQSIINHYLEHCFDILGSGWYRVIHGMKCQGIEGYRFDMGKPVHADMAGKWLAGRINTANLAEAQRIWSLVEPDYVPIDWHIDFKSGYRWSENTYYMDIKYGHKLGVDVKVPWELGRMHHLPQMALYFLSLPEESKERKTVEREFCNQILDFIATNPPQFGVNWACPMDVAIRAANWLVAHDLFRVGSVRFNNDFNDIFLRSIYEHGLHIFKNLEWHDQVRGNHYLANITGLVFIAAYMSSTEEADAWLAFAIQELISEVEHQFYPDGGNFEGSTAYHRLSTEMVYYATALVLGLPQERLEKLKRYDHSILKPSWGKPKLQPAPIRFYDIPGTSKSFKQKSPFPLWYFERMERMAEFIMDITKPNGSIIQIGDNDNGRFFKIGPQYTQMSFTQAIETYANLKGYSGLPKNVNFFMENHLDCSHIMITAYGLFEREDFIDLLERQEEALSAADYFLIKAISANTTIGLQRFNQRKKEYNDFFMIGIPNDFIKVLSEMQTKGPMKITEFSIHEGSLLEGITLRSYPDFGLYLFKSLRLFLAVRCWPCRVPYNSGHMHYDQLSIELVIDGRECLADPGTYLYTPLPSARSRYRSEQAHFSPLPNSSHMSWINTNVFNPLDANPAQVSYFGSIGFFGSTEKDNINYSLAILIQKNKLCVYHYSNNLHSNRHVQNVSVPSSPGYGIQLNEISSS